MQVVGVTIKPVNREMFFAGVQLNLNAAERMFQHAVTINPEFIVEAEKNGHFRDVLNSASYMLVDGVGVQSAIHYQTKTQQLDLKTDVQKYVQFFVSCVDAGILKQEVTVAGVKVERMTGVDVVKELVGKEWMKGKKVFLLGGKIGVAEKAAAALQKLNSEVVFKWSEGHSDIKSQIIDLKIENLDQESLNIIQQINEFKADFLLVAYGHPWQDLWIDKVKDAFTTVRLAMGVGGTFDYLAGKVSRAPEWMRDFGLEWMYRVAKQPERLSRIVDATWRFGKLVIAEGRTKK